MCDPIRKIFTLHNLFIGTYVCVAENTIGTTDAKATITIQKEVGPPILIFEPYDIEALPGTTIEMPCQGEGYPKPEVQSVLLNTAQHFYG